MKRNAVWTILLALVLLMGMLSLAACGNDEAAPTGDFTNEAEMKAALVGTWTTADGAAQFVIEETVLHYTYHFADGSSTDVELSHRILQWDYENRQIVGEQTHIITVAEDGKSFVWSDKTFTRK